MKSQSINLLPRIYEIIINSMGVIKWRKAIVASPFGEALTDYTKSNSEWHIKKEFEKYFETPSSGYLNYDITKDSVMYDDGSVMT